MNAERFEELLAGLLGDELTPAERIELDEALAADRARAARARELQATVAALRAAVPSGALARAVTRAMPTPSVAEAPIGSAISDPAPLTARRVAPAQRSSARRWPLALLRYAAIIALAFGAGHWVRGWQDQPHAPAPAPGNPAVVVAPPAADPLAPGAAGWNPALVERWTVVARQYPQASEFSRALLALARH
jgi:hypothetical protein